MATFTKRLLSGSTDGKPIKVTGTTSGSGANLLHTSVSGTSELDEIWLWAVDISSTSNAILTIEFGNETAPDSNIIMPISAQSGLYLIIPGLLLQNGAEIKVFASIANIVNIVGFVNRITP